METKPDDDKSRLFALVYSRLAVFAIIPSGEEVKTSAERLDSFKERLERGLMQNASL